jgi:hypothetical protein
VSSAEEMELMFRIIGLIVVFAYLLAGIGDIVKYWNCSEGDDD